jgi:Trk-type K+ transport system membrane component
LFTFIIIGLLGALIIYLIENDSNLKNREMVVSYVNAWFVTCTCICGCGLVTLDFALLSKASQIILLILTVVFGMTISTIPALIIKAYTHKHMTGMIVDNDHGNEVDNSEDIHHNSSSSITNQSELKRKLDLLPTPGQIRYWSYLTIITFVLVTCVFIYLFYFLIIGAWLNAQYSKSEFQEGNTTISPWYTSIVIVITGFNQNGLTPFSNSMVRFVNDVYMNIFVIMVFLLVRRFKLKLD